jgi:thiol-disulfide isomerase/thioredoxin
MRRGVAALVGAAVLFGLAGCSSTAAPTAGGDGQGFVTGDGSVAVVDPADRRPAPDLAGTTLSGDAVSLSDLAGDVVVLNVWASWCGPCREEAPYLQAVADESAADGVTFLGINTRDDDAAAQAFERRFEITYPSIVDEDGRLLLAFRDTLPPSAIPSTLVIDRQGRVAARILRSTTYTELKRLVADVAAEPT